MRTRGQPNANFETGLAIIRQPWQMITDDW